MPPKGKSFTSVPFRQYAMRLHNLMQAQNRRNSLRWVRITRTAFTRMLFSMFHQHDAAGGVQHAPVWHSTVCGW